MLLTRAILSFDLNMIVPISRVDENMQRAQRRDACRVGRFFFRKNIFNANKCGDECDGDEMSIDEIVNGSEEFPGRDLL